jgi:ribonuclease D
MKNNLLNSSHVGFDTEFRCISTKYEQQGVSIIQLSTHKHHYIIDFLKL